MSKILIVEDEERLARFIELELSHEGYEAEKVADGRIAVDMALDGDYDLVLLDVMLPGLNGLEVLRRIRREKDIAVIMLTARDAVMDKVAGLDAGADDYITKPFAIEELLARIRVALKHKESLPQAPALQEEEPPQTQPQAPQSASVLQIRGVSLDPERHTVAVQGTFVELTLREFEVLRVLMSHVNKVMSRDQLAQLACGYDYVGDTNIIDVYVRHLRAKIDDRFGIKLITTVRGVGYVVREA
ncbi:MAG: response regulator transcription factor [Coriobacteriales bacterium]|nr:response regulator transcription factor [Coriobacteriales bacterium]